MEAIENTATALIVTGWADIANLDEESDLMQTPVVVDGRRAFKRRNEIVCEGLT